MINSFSAVLYEKYLLQNPYDTRVILAAILMGFQSQIAHDTRAMLVAIFVGFQSQIIYDTRVILV